ncbi:hypothetical protein CS0771_70030 [Catellatospora sp. IY07-71]|uniref:DUF4142 domain-containing protein n=1 Tax=Catellatospora sp. IY07-71 TaxID=2728827 RepID=UPI001BB4302E|nr:DUF4142 domain-containing protein [Catellatospora sp. IY07-71]BCJ77459.1 hypothetical protein CS0771_70030 [Catellatospora sp. IY07-71]
MADKHRNLGALHALAGALAALLALAWAAPAAAAPSPRDVSYLIATHQGNLYAIAAGKLAAQRGANEDVRRLGQTFVDDHTRLDAELRALAQQLKVPLTDQLDGPEQDELKALAAAPAGDAFDQMWITEQIEQQGELYEGINLELNYGYDERVKNLARDADDVILAHIGELNTVDREVSAPAG